MSLKQVKNFIVQWVAYYVHDKMPYDYKNLGPVNPFKSVPLTQIQEDKQAVCRHHALYTQVLLQAFGITSRLLKCNLDSGKDVGESPMWQIW